MSRSSSSSSSGIGFAGLLTIAFIVLKLTNFIDWSWWWVLSPIWMAIGIGTIVLVIGLLGACIVATIQNKRDGGASK